LPTVPAGCILALVDRSLLADAVERYVAAEITRETTLQRRLRAETAPLPQAGMQIGPDQGALLALLVRLIGARRALEIGMPTRRATTPTTSAACSSSAPAG
jgi:O-methyltransferase